MDYLKLTKNHKHIVAHKKFDKTETLLKHSENTLKVFNYLNKEYDIISKLKKSFKGLTILETNKHTEFKLSEKAITLIEEFFIKAIENHDIGKINPKFQTDKFSVDLTSFMSATDYRSIEPFLKNPITETYHSPISALMYLDYYIKEINDSLKGDEKIFTIYILFCFANAIKSHHGELRNLDLTFNQTELKASISNLNIFKEYLSFYNYKFELKGNYGKVFEMIKSYDFDTMLVFIWTKLLYSTLVTCDFIATYSFFNDIKVEDFVLNNKIDVSNMIRAMSCNKIKKGINSYEKDKDYFKKNKLPLINELRSEMAIESLKNTVLNRDKKLFTLESPTGGGKTFMSINCLLELLNTNTKLVYAFPVNTLSTQTKETLDNIFKGAINIQEVNSVSPLPINEVGAIDYQKVLLDKQLWNYQGVVTSNISLFNLFFSNKRESSMGLFSLFNSVIILDEIQNYKNSIWRETIEFLYKYSEIMNIKIIIMSATLPNLEELIGFKKEGFVRLIKNPRIYFENPLFKERVLINRDLINIPISNEFLLKHLQKQVIKRNKLCGTTSKVIIEFITKKSCKSFFEYATINLKDYIIYHLDGDTNAFEKENIIKELKELKFTKNVLLCTTQVVEAGVDIDMDIGYKDAVFPDVDEQFLGRINRSATKTHCVAFFFNLDKEEHIYKGDYRLYSNISNNKYFNCLLTKDFTPLYNDYVFKKLEIIKNNSVVSLYDKFINTTLKMQNFKEIYSTMQLIDSQTFSIFIPSIVNGINGEDIWNEYLNILSLTNYAEKRVKLINLRKCMSYFMYSIYGLGLEGEEAIGGVYYIPNGDLFIENNTFDSESFKSVYVIKK